MSVFQHSDLIEDLKYWMKMQDETATLKDLKIMEGKYHLVLGEKEILVPTDLVEACIICHI